MDMFTPATTESESPEGQEEFEAVEETHEEVETFETEQEEVVEEEQTDPQGQSDQLFWGKFKTPEDAQQAYENLQREYTRLRMDQKASPQQHQQQQPIQQETQDGIDFNDPDSVIAAINRDPQGTIAQIAQQAYQQARTVETQEQQFNRGLDEVASTYREQLQSEDNMKLYFDKVDEVCRELGTNPSKPSPRVLKMAAQELWGDPNQQSNSQLYEQAKSAARAEAERSRQAKVGLGAPKGAKVQEVPKTEADLIRESIVAASRSGGMFG